MPPPPYKVRYLSWNVKNLSTNSLTRFSYNLNTNSTQDNLQVYINTLTQQRIDIMGVIEVTVLTGEKAVKQITQMLGAANWSSITSQKKSHQTRKGEFNALIFKITMFADGNTSVIANATEQLVSRTPNNKIFINRVPVLFKIPLRNPAQSPAKMLQIMTWHAPQPKDMVAQDLATLSESVTDLTQYPPSSSYSLTKQDPMIIAGDFNINTSPLKVAQWNTSFYQSADPYLSRFRGVVSGSKTTLVARDPEGSGKVKVVDFNNLLANCYDNVLVNTTAINDPGQTGSGVVNHLKTMICDDKLRFIVGKAKNITLVVKNANKISDHLGVFVELQIP